MDRRDFLRRSKAVGCTAAAGLTILPNAASVWGAPANTRLALAVVGLRNRGLSLATGFAQRPDCRIAYLCDADSNLRSARVDSVTKAQGGQRPKFAQDFRRALDDAAVNAVVVAAPIIGTAWRRSGPARRRRTSSSLLPGAMTYGRASVRSRPRGKAADCGR